MAWVKSNLGMIPHTFICALVCTLVASSARATLPEAPPSGLPGENSSPIVVDGTESIRWTQIVAGSLTPNQYVAYVDDARRELSDARCETGVSATQLECEATLPQMSAGTHRFELAAVTFASGAETESGRSESLTLLVALAGSTAAAAATAQRQRGSRSPDGAGFDVEILAAGLDRASAVAATPDRRVFVAERSGIVWIWENGRLSREPALRLSDAARGADVGLIGLALHPDFATNAQIFVVYTAEASDHTYVNRVVRYRELSGNFGAGVVILEDRANELPRRTPRIRFGPDRKLYVAFAAGSNRESAEDLSTYTGKLLRLNDDGSTPRDNPGASPVMSYGDPAPAAFDWEPVTGQLWVSDHGGDNRDRLKRLTRARGNAADFVFDSAVDPSGAAFYTNDAIDGFKNNLFIAALTGAHIRRVRFDAKDPTRVVATERLVDGRFGRIGDLAAGSDGALYFCTSNGGTGGGDMLGRLVPIGSGAARQSGR